MMFADVLLCLDPRSAPATSLRRAVEHASIWRARLTVLDLVGREEAEVTRHFELEMDLRSALRLGRVEGRLAERSGGLAGLAHLQATDLILLLTDEAGESGDLDIVSAVLESSGVPVLAERGGGNRTPTGRRVLLPWAGDRASRRAVRDAMPILANADEVALVACGGEDHGLGGELADVAGHLARHGAKVRIETSEWFEAADGAAISACAARLGADLVVLGLGGPPRWPRPTVPAHAEALLREGSTALLISP